MASLLIAGALALDDFTTLRGMLGGVGGYAAMAAAPLAHTQLWSHGGNGITPQVRSILERRGIDISGVEWTGATNAGTHVMSPALPSCEPTEAGDLRTALLIGLNGDDYARARQVIGALPDARDLMVVVAPCQADPTQVESWCHNTDVLVIRQTDALASTDTTDSCSAARALQQLGCNCVILTAGEMGGAIFYRNKSATYPAMPITVNDPTGTHATFAGVVAAWLTGAGKDDYQAVRRACAVGSAVGAQCALGVGPKKLLGSSREDYLERFHQLRRATKS